MAKNSPSSLTDHGLNRQLGLRDLVLAQVLCVVGTGWVGVAAGLGRGQALTWIAAMLLFYLPCASMVIGLNRIMPLEGGLYVWARQAFGEMGGFLAAWNLWVYAMAATAAIVYAIPTELAYLIGPKAAWLPENRMAALGIVAGLLLVLTLTGIRGLELGKWIHNLGGVAVMTAFAGLILLPAWVMWRHRLGAHGSDHPLEFPLALPPLNLRSLAMFGQMMVGGLSGIEYIAIFAGESRQPAESISRSVWISSPIICAMFILGTGAVVAFATPGHIDFVAPIPQTLRLALGNSGISSLVAMGTILLLQIRLIGAASYLFTGVSRLPMAVGWDHLLPAWFTRLHKDWKTPVNSILCTAGLMMLLIVMSSVGVHAQEAFQVLTNAATTHYALAYAAMFAIPLVGAGALRRRLPGWLRWVGLAGLSAALISFLVSVYPIVNVVNPLGYAAKIAGTVLISNAAAVGFYAARNRRVRSEAA